MNRLAPILFALACAGCRQDMQIQPKYTPLKPSSFYADGRSARRIPQGTVDTEATEEDPGLEGGSVNGAFVTSIPLPVTQDLLERGHERFNIFCSPCHGRTGNGDGMVAERGIAQPSNLNDERTRNAPPGYIYQVIVKGYGAMDDYAYQIKSVRDRWAIVAYIRALELSRQATLDDIPADQRSKLESKQ